MDPLSIVTTCIGLTSSITSLAFKLTTFVRDVRDSRTEIDEVTRELLSLKTILELIADDVENSARPLPRSLEKQISGVVSNCAHVVGEVGGCIQSHEGSRIEKGAHWVAFGRSDMARLRSTLEAHKSTLNLALEMVSLTILRDVQQDTVAVKHSTDSLVKDSKDLIDGTARILEAISDLQAKLPSSLHDRSDSRFFMLSRYLDELTSYAETVTDDAEARLERLTVCSGDESDAESSSSRLTAKPISPGTLQKRLLSLSEGSNTTLAEPNTDTRNVKVDSSEPKATPPDDGLQNMILHDARAQPTKPQEETETTKQKPLGNESKFDDGLEVVHHYPRSHNIIDVQELSLPFSEVVNISAFKSLPVETVQGSEHRPSGISEPDERSVPPAPLPDLLIYEQFPERPTQARTTLATKRLSKSFSPRLREWWKDVRKDGQGEEARKDDQRGDSRKDSQKDEVLRKEGQKGEVCVPQIHVEALGVFGVPLEKLQSMPYANFTISFVDKNDEQHCDGYIPTVVYKCCSLLKQKGAYAREVFRQRGKPKRIDALRRIFDTPPSYGQNLDLARNGYTCHDAADLLFLYLSALPGLQMAWGPDTEESAKHLGRVRRVAPRILDGVNLAKGPVTIEPSVEFFHGKLAQQAAPLRHLYMYLLDTFAFFASNRAGLDVPPSFLARTLGCYLFKPAPGAGFDEEAVTDLTLFLMWTSDDVLVNHQKPTVMNFSNGVLG